LPVFDFSGGSGHLQPRRKQILALSGGGYRGLYSASFLMKAEASFHCRVNSRFQMISGTSIGALLGAALALGVPASAIVEKFIAHGPRIFPRKAFLTWARKSFFAAPYSSKPLENAVIDTLGRENAALSLRQIDFPLALVAVNCSNGAPFVFRSRGLAGNGADDASVLEAVLASAAAPTYFPPRKLGMYILIDGGVIANAPEMLAVTEARGTLGWPLEDLFVLGIGTASSPEGSTRNEPGNPSSLAWMLGRRLFQTTLTAQEILAVEQSRTFLGNHYYRVDRKPSSEQARAINGLDTPTPASTKALQDLGEQSWSEHESKFSFRSFFLTAPQSS
jgi:uncharacterized protein